MMRVFKWFIAWIVLIVSATAYAQLMTTFVGPGSNGGGTVIAACGTGVINLSTGCTQPMLGGL